MTASEASDSGAWLVDHALWGLDSLCYRPERRASVERCRPIAERFRRNGTWSVANVVNQGFPRAVLERFWDSLPG